MKVDLRCLFVPLGYAAAIIGDGAQVETVAVTIELPVSGTLRSYVAALEAARDAQTDLGAKRALAAVTALASRGLVITVGNSLESAGRQKP